MILKPQKGMKKIQNKNVVTIFKEAHIQTEQARNLNIMKKSLNAINNIISRV